MSTEQMNEVTSSQAGAARAASGISPPEKLAITKFRDRQQPAAATSEIARFDPLVEALDLPQLAERISQKTAELAEVYRAGVPLALRLGEYLFIAQWRVGKGTGTGAGKVWAEWLKANTTFSERSASGYMRIYRNREKLPENELQYMTINEAARYLRGSTKQKDEDETITEPTEYPGRDTEPEPVIIPPEFPSEPVYIPQPEGPVIVEQKANELARSLTSVFGKTRPSLSADERVTLTASLTSLRESINRTLRLIRAA